MFTGIIEGIGEIAALRKEKENLHLTIKSALATKLKVDQSVAHNGVCLTVVSTSDESYTVTVILETLKTSSLGKLETGDHINLERAMKLGDRLDGHLVQGHVDQTGVCEEIREEGGSWIFRFSYDPSQGNVTITKGSITINGVSLTVVESENGSFSVAIIPFTFENTSFKYLEKGMTVNLEFDLIGKYLKRLVSGYL